MIRISQDNKETQRIETFSDGVFSIIITLLVLELKIPEIGNEVDLKIFLVKQWPSYIAFFSSFFTILILWINHYALFLLIQNADNKFIYINGILLFLVSITLFTTALVARYINTDEASLVMFIYALQFLLCNIVFNILWNVVKNHKTTISYNIHHKVLKTMTDSYLLGLPGYGLAAIIAWNYPFVSFGICSAFWIFWATLTIRIKKSAVKEFLKQ